MPELVDGRSGKRVFIGTTAVSRRNWKIHFTGSRLPTAAAGLDAYLVV
jgi:hypothetical protein